MSPFARRRLAQKLRARGAVVELTPLIDIVFQLLIFFVLTATLNDQSSIDVELARAKSQQQASPTKSVIVSISKDGRYEIDRNIVELRELEMRLCAKAKAGETAVHIRGDKASQLESLVAAMDVAKSCGMQKMGLLHQN